MHTRLGQTAESQVDTGFQVASTCESVWPWLKKNSTYHYTILISFLTAMEQWVKELAECKKKDFRNWLSCHIRGIDMNCKDDGLNVNVYSKRADRHSFPGEFTRLYLFQFINIYQLANINFPFFELLYTHFVLVWRIC